jgi:anti-sigma B factor antagonist
LPLSLDTREVGRVTIVHCNGRIVASETESLRAHVAWLLRDRRSIVLHLGEVGFIDSSGLGTMVRALTTTRQAHGDLKLCNVPEFVRKVLEMSRLNTIFDTHESEEKAVAAFYRPGARAEAPAPTGHSILCLDANADVLAYLRELLRRAGYDVQSSSRVADALLLMRVTHFDLLLVGAGMAASPTLSAGLQGRLRQAPGHRTRQRVFHQPCWGSRRRVAGNTRGPAEFEKRLNLIPAVQEHGKGTPNIWL